MPSLCHRWILSIFFIATFLATSCQTQSCLPDWHSFIVVGTSGQPQVKCIRTFADKISGFDVEYYCRNSIPLDSRKEILNDNDTMEVALLRNAHSLSIHSEEENVLVSELVWRDVPYPPRYADRKSAWLGGVSSASVHVWFDQTPFNVTLFDQVLTDNETLNLPQGGCIATGPFREWMVAECEEVRPYVCGYEPRVQQTYYEIPSAAPAITTEPSGNETNTSKNELPTTTAVPRKPREYRYPRPSLPDPILPCPEGWTFYKISGRCYRVFEGPASQYAAEETCSKYNSHLTSVMDNLENRFVSEMVQNFSAFLQEGLLFTKPTTPWKYYIGARFSQYGAVGMWTNKDSWNVYNFPIPWGPKEPSEMFGCISLSDEKTEDPNWYYEDCRDEVKGFVCGFQNNETSRHFSTSPPTTVPSMQTTEPPSSVTPRTVECKDGWKGFIETGWCYKLLPVSARGYTAEEQCKANFLTVSTHSVSIASSSENMFLQSMLQESSALPDDALVGGAYVADGEDGFWFDEREVPFTNFSRWAANEPRSDFGCIRLRKNGYWFGDPCSVSRPGLFCRYDPKAIQHGTLPPSQSGTPVNPIPPLSERIGSLNGKKFLVVLSGTSGFYTVQPKIDARFPASLPAVERSLPGLIFWFTFDSNPNRCETSSSFSSFDLNNMVAVSQDNTLSIFHSRLTENAVICVSEDGKKFFDTGLRFAVRNSRVDGLAPISLNATAREHPRSELTIPWGSSGTIRVFGVNLKLLRAFRFSSDENCNNPMYTYGPSDIYVSNARAAYFEIFPEVPPFSTSGMSADRTPPTSFHVCVAAIGSRTIDGSPVPPDDSRYLNLYTRVPGLEIRVPARLIVTTGLFQADTDTVARLVTAEGRKEVARKASPSISVLQYEMPVIGLLGLGLHRGMQIAFASDKSSCRLLSAKSDYFGKDVALAPLLSQGSEANMTHGGVPLSLNHTGPAIIFNSNENYTGPLDAPREERFHVCLSSSAASPFLDTDLQLIVKENTVMTLNGKNKLNLHTGFAGILSVGGLDSRAIPRYVTASMRLVFVVGDCTDPNNEPYNSALSIVQAAPYADRDAPLMVVVPEFYFREQPKGILSVCLAAGYGYPRSSTRVTISISLPRVLFVGRNTNDVNSGIKLSVSTTSIALPVVGYGLSERMSFVLNKVPCATASAITPHNLVYNLSMVHWRSSALGYQLEEPLDPVLGVVLEPSHLAVPMGPLYICLYSLRLPAPIATEFSFSVVPPKIIKMTNARESDQNSNSTCIVQFAITEDLVVTGVGLTTGFSMIPAVDCEDETTFLWPSPLNLSAVPLFSETGSQTDFIMQRDDMQYGEGTMFLPISQHVSVISPSQKNLTSPLQWCFWGPSFGNNFVSTGLPFTYIPSSIEGFKTQGGPMGASKNLILTEGSPFHTVSILGSVQSIATAFFYLQWTEVSCKNFPETFRDTSFPSSSSSSGSAFAVRKNALLLLHFGQAVISREDMPTAGKYKLCFAVDQPPLNPIETNAADNFPLYSDYFVEAKGITVTVVATPVSAFSVNFSTSALVFTGDRIDLALEGVGLEQQQVRLIPSTASEMRTIDCTENPQRGSDIPILTSSSGVGAKYRFLLDSSHTNIAGYLALCVSKPATTKGSKRAFIPTRLHVTVVTRSIDTLNGNTGTLDLEALNYRSSNPTERLRVTVSGTGLKSIPSLMLGSDQCFQGAIVPFSASTNSVGSFDIPVEFIANLSTSSATYPICYGTAGGRYLLAPNTSIRIAYPQISSCTSVQQENSGNKIQPLKLGESGLFRVEGRALKKDMLVFPLYMEGSIFTDIAQVCSQKAFSRGVQRLPSRLFEVSDSSTATPYFNMRIVAQQLDEALETLPESNTEASATAVSLFLCVGSSDGHIWFPPRTDSASVSIFVDPTRRVLPSVEYFVTVSGASSTLRLQASNQVPSFLFLKGRGLRKDAVFALAKCAKAEGCCSNLPNSSSSILYSKIEDPSATQTEGTLVYNTSSATAGLYLLCAQLEDGVYGPAASSGTALVVELFRPLLSAVTPSLVAIDSATDVFVPFGFSGVLPALFDRSLSAEQASTIRILFLPDAYSCSPAPPDIASYHVGITKVTNDSNLLLWGVQVSYRQTLTMATKHQTCLSFDNGITFSDTDVTFSVSTILGLNGAEFITSVEGRTEWIQVSGNNLLPSHRLRLAKGSCNEAPLVGYSVLGADQIPVLMPNIKEIWFNGSSQLTTVTLKTCLSTDGGKIYVEQEPFLRLRRASLELLLPQRFPSSDSNFDLKVALESQLPLGQEKNTQYLPIVENKTIVWHVYGEGIGHSTADIVLNCDDPSSAGPGAVMLPIICSPHTGSCIVTVSDVPSIQSLIGRTFSVCIHRKQEQQVAPTSIRVKIYPIPIPKASENIQSVTVKDSIDRNVYDSALSVPTRSSAILIIDATVSSSRFSACSAFPLLRFSASSCDSPQGSQDLFSIPMEVSPKGLVVLSPNEQTRSPAVYSVCIKSPCSRLWTEAKVSQSRSLSAKVENPQLRSLNNRQNVDILAGETVPVEVGGVGLMKTGSILRFVESSSTPPNIECPEPPQNSVLDETMSVDGKVALRAGEISSASMLFRVCFCTTGDDVFRPSNVTVTIRKSSADIVRPSPEMYTPTLLARDARVVRMLVHSRGNLDLCRLLTPQDLKINESVKEGCNRVFPQGSTVIFSDNCMYNSRALPIMRVHLGSISLTSHSDTPTVDAPLKLCIRRKGLRNFGGSTAVELFFSPFHQETPWSIAVLNFSVASVGGLNPTQESTFSVLTLDAASPAILDTKFAGEHLEDTDKSVDSMLSLAFLIAVGQLKFRVGKPCSSASESFNTNMSAAVSLGAPPVIVKGDASSSFVHSADSKLLVEGSDNGLAFFLAIPPSPGNFSPLSKYSLCVSADGGRFYFSTGFAVTVVSHYHTPSELLFNPSAPDVSLDDWWFSASDDEFMKGTGAEQRTIHIYEGGFLDVPIIASPKNEETKSAMTPAEREYSAATLHYLWSGFVNQGQGYLYRSERLRSEDGSRRSELRLVYSAPNINSPVESVKLKFLDNQDSVPPFGRSLTTMTGLTVIIHKPHLECIAERRNLKLFRGEYGKSFWISPECGPGIEEGTVLRLASVGCDFPSDRDSEGYLKSQGSPTNFVVDVVVSRDLRFVVPREISYLSNSVLHICIIEQTPDVSTENVTVLRTPVTIEVSTLPYVDSVDGVQRGTIALFANETAELFVDGAGVSSEGSLAFSFVPPEVDCDKFNIDVVQATEDMTDVLFPEDQQSSRRNASTTASVAPPPTVSPQKQQRLYQVRDRSLKVGKEFTGKLDLGITDSSKLPPLQYRQPPRPKVWRLCYTFDAVYYQSVQDVFITVVPPTVSKLVTQTENRYEPETSNNAATPETAEGRRMDAFPPKTIERSVNAEQLVRFVSGSCLTPSACLKTAEKMESEEADEEREEEENDRESFFNPMKMRFEGSGFDRLDTIALVSAFQASEVGGKCLGLDRTQRSNPQPLFTLRVHTATGKVMSASPEKVPPVPRSNTEENEYYDPAVIFCTSTDGRIYYSANAFSLNDFSSVQFTSGLENVETYSHAHDGRPLYGRILRSREDNSISDVMLRLHLTSPSSYRMLATSAAVEIIEELDLIRAHHRIASAINLSPETFGSFFTASLRLPTLIVRLNVFTPDDGLDRFDSSAMVDNSNVSNKKFSRVLQLYEDIRQNPEPLSEAVQRSLAISGLTLFRLEALRCEAVYATSSSVLQPPSPRNSNEEEEGESEGEKKKESNKEGEEREENNEDEDSGGAPKFLRDTVSWESRLSPKDYIVNTAGSVLLTEKSDEKATLFSVFILLLIPVSLVWMTRQIYINYLRD